MNYRSAVAEGRRLVKAIDQAGWELARLTWEVLDTDVTQTKWAADLGVSRGHVGALAFAWERYGGTRSKRTFPEAYALGKFSEQRASEIEDEADRTGLSASTVAHRGAPQAPTRHQDKVEMARELLSDRRVVEEALSEPDTWNTVMRSAEKLEAEPTLAEPRARRPNKAAELNQAWHEWLNQLNTLLMRGADLAERTEREGVALDAYGTSGHLVYERITERKLDAEIRDLFESAERGESR